LHLGQAGQLACIWEATARKAGNVHRFQDFEDLAYPDFLVSGLAIASSLDHAMSVPLGETILSAIQETRKFVRTNTNLGIVLLLAPLATIQDPFDRDELEQLLESTTVQDSELVYRAIQLAVPGGMGEVPEQDISTRPTQTLIEVMRLAKDHDMIARQYDEGFVSIFEYVENTLANRLEWANSLEELVIGIQLDWLAAHPDSLIQRKCGETMALEVRRQALDVLFGGKPYHELDTFLRADGHRRNPGTTADLVTASLFLALRQNRINLSLPFALPSLPDTWI
jgi:triphosphoribosyl-dephospho-CoA synthase